MSNELQLISETPKDIMIALQKHAATVNLAPKKEWLKKTPDGKADYIPIEIIERELRQDFNGLVQFELLTERRELNEYIATARIKAFHPVILQWMNYDGIGSVVIMQDKDATLESFAATKKKNALTLNAPKAYAEAIKNAAKKIGEKYGANINRKEDAPYEPKELIREALDNVTEMFKSITTEKGLMELYGEYPELHSNSKFKMAFSQAKKALNETTNSI